MSAVVMAIANLKGGVGNVTTAVSMATGLSRTSGQRVLLIDLDPQAISSQMLLTEAGVNAAFARRQGVFPVLSTATDGRLPEAKSLIVEVSSLPAGDPSFASLSRPGSGRLAAIPCHPLVRLRELAMEEAWFVAGSPRARLSARIEGRLANLISTLRADFDVIILDCPPNLSLLSRAGRKCADSYITPFEADTVSLLESKTVGRLRDAENLPSIFDAARCEALRQVFRRVCTFW